MEHQPIRVLNLFTIMNRGGAETMVMNYYRNIDRTKVQFDFLVHRTERGAYDDEIESLGGRIYRLCPIYPQNFIKYKRLLHTFFSEHEEYQIIHSHMSELGYFAFKEAKKQGRQIRICHAHSSPHYFDLKMIMRNYFKIRMMPYITHMFTCGKEAGDWLYGENNEKNFIFLNNAVESEKYSFNTTVRKEIRNEFRIENELVIGHVGSFLDVKNHDFLVEVFVEILKMQPNAKLLLVGKGILEDQIKEKVKRLGVQDKVIFAGLRGDVHKVLQAMDVFIFPSLYEGLPVSLIEAQAAGLPIIISDKIPIECKKTELIYTLSLQDALNVWAKKAIDIYNTTERKDMSKEITKSGFDIKSNCSWLQKFYLDCYKV